MAARKILALLGAVAAAIAVPLTVPTAASAAEGCPDLEVIFARGTGEPVGLGLTGAALAESVRLYAGGRSVGSYGVNYPASGDFNNRDAIFYSIVDGVRDTGNRLQFMSNACPNTRFVIGGYSQGAVVAAYVTSDGAPAGLPAHAYNNLPSRLSDDIANKIVSVVFFGKPSERFAADAGAPGLFIGGRFAPKVQYFCNLGDNICDGSPLAGPGLAHALYAVNGSTLAAADFVGRRL